MCNAIAAMHLAEIMIYMMLLEIYYGKWNKREKEKKKSIQVDDHPGSIVDGKPLFNIVLVDGVSKSLSMEGEDLIIN